LKAADSQYRACPNPGRENSQGVDKMMTILLKNPASALPGAFTSANRYVAQSGTSRLPNPKLSPAARMKRSLRENFMYDRTLIPETTTLAKRKVVTPPRTGLGIERKTPEILPRTGKVSVWCERRKCAEL
jgi:hypothetical protein